MNPFAQDSQGTSSGSGGSTNPFAPKSSSDLNSSIGLYNLAQAQGGTIAQAADELVHPSTSILSTIGNGFKNAFSKFVDFISIPSEVVAGVLSDKYSISDAIKNKIRPSDVIFGDQNPDNTTMQKIGSFLVRTATDIVLDPLTYVGELPFKGALQSISLEEKGAAALGKSVEEAGFATAKINRDVGTPLYKALTAQANGVAKADELFTQFSKGLENTGKLNKIGMTGEEVTTAAKSELDKLILKQSIDAPLDIDFAKKAMSNLIEAHPALAETIIDKGGFKYFGKTLLSSQRISSALQLIPGMTMLDEATLPMRRFLQAPFDPAIIKSEETGKYVRLPEEFVALKNSSAKIRDMQINATYRNLENIVKENKLTAQEAINLSDSLMAGTMPADKRLANAYTQYMAENENQLKWMQESGIPIARRESFGMPLTQERVSNVNIKGLTKGGITKKAGASFERTTGKFVNTETGESTIGTAESLGLERKTIDNQETYKELFTDSNGKEYERFNATMTELRNAGFKFEPNAIIAQGIRAADNARAGSMTRMMRNAAEMFGRLEDEAPEGWRALNVGKETSERLGLSSGESDFAINILGKNGKQIVFHPAIAQALEDSGKAMFNDAATQDVFKYFDKVQSLWKAGVTSIFPAFHGRNAISNVFQNFLDIGYHAINPASHSAATQLVYEDKIANKLERLSFSTDSTVAEKAKLELQDHLNKTFFTDATGKDWSSGELRQILKKKGIAFVGGTGQIDVDSMKGIDDISKDLFGVEGNVNKAKNIAGTIATAPIKGGRLVGSMIEDQAKVLNFITNLKATGDVNHAAARTAMFLFDYSNLTNFEKTFMKRVLPFYTFTRKNLELQVKTLLENPSRISQEIHGLTSLGQALSGGQLSQEDEDKLPDWIKSGINILGSKKGNKVSIYGSFGTPIEQPFAALQINQILGSVSPLIRLPIEQATGYSWFQQKPLSDVSNAAAFKNAPQAIKNFIGYTEVTGKDKNGQEYKFATSLHPENMNILNNLPFYGRVMSSLKQMDNVDISTQDKILQQLIGVRPFSFDLEQEQNKKEATLESELKQLLTKAGVTAQFTRTYIPKN